MSSDAFAGSQWYCNFVCNFRNCICTAPVSAALHPIEIVSWTIELIMHTFGIEAIHSHQSYSKFHTFMLNCTHSCSHLTTPTKVFFGLLWMCLLVKMYRYNKYSRVTSVNHDVIPQLKDIGILRQPLLDVILFEPSLFQYIIWFLHQGHVRNWFYYSLQLFMVCSWM